MIDIPAQQILETFERGTTFVDIATEQTRKKLLEVERQLQKKVEAIIQEDITGLYSEVIAFIDRQFREGTDLSTILNNISQELNDILSDHNRTDMNPVAEALGRDKYDFVSSSFLISQLGLGIIFYVQQLALEKPNCNLNILEQNNDYLEFKQIAIRLNLYMMGRHFELLAKLLKPNGILHLSATTNSIYFTSDGVGGIIREESKPIIPFELLQSSLPLFFEPQSDLQTSWPYVKQMCTPGNPVGELYTTLSIPCKPKLDENGKKIDDWSKLMENEEIE